MLTIALKLNETIWYRNKHDDAFQRCETLFMYTNETESN
jgi:hypothetical protein